LNDNRFFVTTALSPNTDVFIPIEQYRLDHRTVPPDLVPPPIVRNGTLTDYNAPMQNSLSNFYGPSTSNVPDQSSYPDLIRPAQLMRELNDLPEGGAGFPRIFIDDRPSVQNPYSSVQFFEKQNGAPFFAQMNVGSDQMNIFPYQSNLDSQERLNALWHEDGHVWERNSLLRANYETAATLERKLSAPLLVTPYAGYSTSENWAEEARLFGNGSDKDVNQLVAAAKDSPSAPKVYLIAKALQEQLLRGKEAGHIAPRFDELMDRSLWAQQELGHSAKAQLNRILSDATSSEETQAQVLSLYPTIFKDQAAEGLLAIDPTKIKDSHALLTAINAAHNYEIPDSTFLRMIESKSPLSAEALILFGRGESPNSKALISSMAEDGRLVELMRSEGRGRTNELLSRMISDHIKAVPDSHERLRLMKLNLDSASSDSARLDLLGKFALMRFPSGETEHLQLVTRFATEREEQSAGYTTLLTVLRHWGAL
jgi:hypothetical protein